MGDVRYAIGVDLGGTKIEMGVVDNDGTIHQSLRLAAKKGYEAVLSQLIEGANQLLQQTKLPIEGVGIGVAAQIEKLSEMVLFAPNLDWHHVPLKSDMQLALKIPICVNNDVRVISLGEWLFGAGKGCRDLVCLFIGTGIGSGIVIHGELVSGFSNTFGEVGHLSVDFRGPKCTCGSLGCLEAFAGGWGIAARAGELIDQSPKEKGMSLRALIEKEGGILSAKMVLEAYRQGDLLATQVIEQAKQALIIGCASIVNGFNPQRLILGGGVVDGWPELVGELNEGMRRYALKVATNQLEVVRAAMTKEAGIVGAATMLFHRTR